MRIIKCPECKGDGSIKACNTYIKCARCNGYGKMNIREWIYWKWAYGKLFEKFLSKELDNLLWKLKEIGEK